MLSAALVASKCFALASAATTPIGNDLVTNLAARSEYRIYVGDGTVAAGWPSQEDWKPFETAWYGKRVASE